MIIMSFSEDHGKVRFIFTLFDFDMYQSLDKDQFTLMTMIFLEAWARFSGGSYSSRVDLEKVGRAVYSSRDGRITITEIAEWIELNKPLTNLLKSLNPTLTVPDRLSSYLPIEKPKLHYV